ncbi:hypothetical protein HK100_002192 [Physocladia obscura]|uniref:Uncharacterized protein n=1 Tax=Physocladia obscura TaxID=109957 RepID=A0AAD5XLC7_9FUNG|nr:hypothetical protein HK100_002192 [Physocladia obscura]
MDFQEQITLAYTVLAGISLVQWLIYTFFVVHYEIKKRDRPVKMKTIFTPFNLPLIIGTLCFAIVYTIRAIQISESLIVPWGLPFALEQLLTGTTETCYIFFSWRRSGKLIGSVFSTRVYKFMYYIVIISPAIFYLPIVPCVWMIFLQDSSPQGSVSTWLFNISYFVAGFMTAVVDLVLLIAFIRNLRLSYLEREDINREFTIVAYHGVVTCGLCFTTIALFLSAQLFTDITVHTVKTLIAHAIPNIISMVLFSMKVKLRNHQIFEETNKDPVSMLMMRQSVKSDLAVAQEKRKTKSPPTTHDEKVSIAFHPLRSSATEKRSRDSNGSVTGVETGMKRSSTMTPVVLGKHESGSRENTGRSMHSVSRSVEASGPSISLRGLHGQSTKSIGQTTLGASITFDSSRRGTIHMTQEPVPQISRSFLPRSSIHDSSQRNSVQKEKDANEAQSSSSTSLSG